MVIIQRCFISYYGHRLGTIVQESRVSDQSSDDPCTGLRASVRAAAHELNNTLSVLRLTLDLLEGEQLDIPAAAAQLREQIDEQRVVRGQSR